MNTEYFAPLLSVNKYSSRSVLEEIPSGDLFASLSNWLMRPVPTVSAAVQKFKERYFEDNYVIGERSVSRRSHTLVDMCMCVLVLGGSLLMAPHGMLLHPFYFISDYR